MVRPPRYIAEGSDVARDVNPSAPVAAESPAREARASAASRTLVALPLEGDVPALGGNAPTRGVNWDDLMRKHGRRVIVSLVGRGLPLERAQELAQEAWMRIIAQHRAGRLDRLEMPGLVVTQATFLAHDEHRRRGRRAKIGLSPADGTTEVPDLADAITGPDLERRMEARQALRRVLDVVDRAYPNAQRVFHLLYGADPKTPAEVADVTGLSVQRVRQILCELRKAIRTELASKGTKGGNR